MADSSPWSFQLNREDILARRLKREELVGQIETLQRQLTEEDRWYEAIRLIVPASLILGIEDAIDSTRENPDRASVWRDAIMAAFLNANGGLLPRDIVQHIRELGSYEAKERLIRNPNGVYNALSRLCQDGKLVKQGDKFYRPEIYQFLKEIKALDEDAEERVNVGVTAVILKFFDEKPRMMPKDIISRLRQYDEYAERISRNPQYGYSAINRLTRQKRLKKDGAYYVLSSNENEPHDVEASHGSDAGSKEDIFS